MNPRSTQPAESALCSQVLAVAGHRARSKLLRSLATQFSPALVSEFCVLAHTVMRQEPDEANRRTRLGALVADAIGDVAGKVKCLRGRAQACVVGGKHAVALRLLDQALKLSDVVGDEISVADLEALRVLALVHLERHAEAEEVGRRSLALFEAQGNRDGSIRVLMSLADLAFRRDEPRAALRHYSKVDRLIPPGELPRIRGAVAGNRANALEACNRLRAATRQFETARRIFAAEGCDHTVAQVDYNTAYAEALRAQYQDALHRYARTEAEFRRLGDSRHLAHIDLDRAEIHLELNLPADAQTYAAAALERFTRLALVKETGQAHLLLGKAAELRGATQEASGHFVSAQETFEQLAMVERQAGCIVRRACLAETAGRPDEARVLADQAGALLGEDANPLSRASLDLLRARLHLAQGRHNEALDLADTVLTYCRRAHAPWVRMEGLRIVGRANALRGETEQAILAYKRAIDVLERYRGGVPPDEFMSAFLAGRSTLYADIIDLLARQGEHDLAFQFAERAKSRALVDLLASGRGKSHEVARSTTPTARRLSYLRERLNAVYGRLFRSGEEHDRRSRRLVEQARLQASEIEDEIVRLIRKNRMEDREGASLRAVDATTVRAVQRDLEPGTALLEYYLTDERLTTFVITRDAIHVVTQDVNARRLNQVLVRFHFHLAKHEQPTRTPSAMVLEATRRNLGALADILLEPIATHLDAERLVVVPHGLLHQVPFHALPWDDGWLTDRFEIVYAPSAAVYGFCKRNEALAEGAPCVLGVPDDIAPQIESEARSVALRLGTDNVYLRDEATLARLEEAARDARIVHIAAHGMFRHAQPMLSAIRLADGWVNLYDLYGLRMNCELVVLATCESGTADVTSGDEILGLTRGLLYAGTPAVMTSQWRVNDAVTSRFMQVFYVHLERLGDAATAHRRTMAEIRADHPHPYYWAPFFLTGRPVVRMCSPPGTKNTAAPVPTSVSLRPTVGALPARIPSC